MPSLPRVFLATSARRTINTSDVLTAKIFRNRRSSAKKYAFERRNRSSSVTTAGRTGVDVQAGERKVLKQEIPNDENRERRQRRIHYATAAAATIGTSAAIFSIATRKWRDDRIATLTPAAASGAFYYPSGKSRSSSPSWKNASLPSSLEESSSKRLINSQQHNTIIDNNSRGWPCKRNLKTLLETVERAGLMGKKPSVKDELDSIRKWHVDHGYRGGLVIRELNVPLFEGSMLFPYNWGNNDIDEDGDNEEERSDGDRNENEKSIVDGVVRFVFVV